ncbi:hypothetical protein ONE63_008143 [Megalurothrips usitatus]|uniref:RNA-directed DNA polymerase n=1 Tax=Megalurothrips usitatus TaxID=439358 RepID=A0AAV7XK92_9NEOP|nr:hypothetical protein ONE63_008143 [Megalurothrips usitatus]
MIVEKGVDKETNEMKYRLVLSAKKLNEALAKINYGPPRIPDVLIQLKGQDLYSVIELSSSFHQLAVDERDRHILTIQHEGQLYRYRKMPMGLSVSSQYLCYALTLALGDALFNTCLSYVDDTIVFSRGGMGAHAAAVEDVLSRFRRANFGVNGDKCTFGYKKVGFLGYIVDGEGYRPNPDKFRELEKLLDVKTPREAKRAYCYFSYYRSFIPNFHKIAHPVLQAGNADKETFRWGETEQQAVATLHRGLLKEVTLVHFDDRRPTIITVDGSPVYGAGAVMLQKCSCSRKYRPVSVFSKTFPRIQRSRAPYEPELLALKYTLEHWRPELLALPAFEIRTDCASLKTLPALDKVTSNQATFQRLLGEFSGKYKIIHKAAKEMVCADFHSRTPPDRPRYDMLDEELDAWVLPDDTFRGPSEAHPVLEKPIRGIAEEDTTSPTAQIIQERLREKRPRDLCEVEGAVMAVTRARAMRGHFNEDPELSPDVPLPGVTLLDKQAWRLELTLAQESAEEIRHVREHLKEKGEAAGYTLINGLVYVSGHPYPRIWVPASLVKKVLANCHDSILGGHMGAAKTLALIQTSYFFPRMAEIVSEYVANCHQCARNKSKLRKSGLLQPVQSDRPFQVMACDFMEVTRSGSDSGHCLVVVDLYSGMIFGIPTRGERTKDAKKALLSLMPGICVPTTLIYDEGETPPIPLPELPLMSVEDTSNPLGVPEKQRLKDV